VELGPDAFCLLELVAECCGYVRGGTSSLDELWEDRLAQDEVRQADERHLNELARYPIREVIAAIHDYAGAA
jgi:hypothetical protein